MTAVKERFMQILPEMQRDVPRMADSDLQLLMNYYFQLRPANKTEEDVSYRIGAGEGEFVVPEDFDAGQEEIYAEEYSAESSPNVTGIYWLIIHPAFSARSLVFIKA